MASINQVSLEFSTKGERQAIQALKNLNLSTEKLKTTQVSASQAAARLDAQRKKETRELERLRGKYIQGHAAMEMYSREMNDLARARRANIISAEQQTAEVARLNQVYRQGSTATGGFADANHIASRQTNAAGMAMQQAGYQVGDFAVQVQSGTNAFVAFGQQATQLVGVLPMMASQFGMNVNTLIKWSAGLGVVIPITTALAAAFMRTRDDAKTFEDATFDINKAAKSATEELEKYREEVAKLSSEYETLGEVGFDKQIKNLESELNQLTARRQKILQSAMTGFSASGGSFSEKELQRMVGDALTANTSEIENQIRLKQQQLNQLVLERNSLETLKRLTGDTNELVEKGHQAQIERNRTNMEAIRNKEEELRMLQLVVEHGQESIEVVRARAKQEAIAKNLTTENQQKYIDLAVAIAETRKLTEDSATAADKLREELGDAAFEALRLADVDMESGIDDATKAAAELAAKLGIALGRASRIQSMSVLEARGEQMVGGLGGPSGPRGLLPQDPNEIRNLPDFETDTPVFGSSRSGGGSAQSTVDETEKVREAVDKLIASYDEQYATSLKIADAQETVNKALNLGVISGSEATSIMEQYEASLRDVEDPMMKIAQTARDELGDALMSIVDGTASAEDAFKNMARAILKEAFDLLVIKPLMDSLFGSSGIFGGFGSGGSSVAPVTGAGGLYANGGAFSNGNVIPFANGGVVSSPTMFPMAGQQTGVMGEAGPEAIMPLKRGKGGKLGVVAEGGQGDVVINQSFNISANGDDSVKRIIQQEAPKIANYTSQKIMEQRQRGGAMKQTFR